MIEILDFTEGTNFDKITILKYPHSSGLYAIVHYPNGFIKAMYDKCEQNYTLIIASDKNEMTYPFPDTKVVTSENANSEFKSIVKEYDLE